MDKVSLRNVWKIYPGAKTAAPAVRDFNLDIGDGEFMVFVGASGCGKTTTLRMIAGLESISKGEILIDGKVVNNLSPRQRNIAMVFQNYALYPNLTLFENMAFGLRLRKMEKYKINELVNQKARKLEIDHLLDRLPKDVSGGQRQRGALGRAIVRDPSVFLMDEPLSNLDAKMRVQMRSEIIRLHQELHTTTVYVTHDQTEAMTMGDRIVVMKDGLIQQFDTPKVLYSSPDNLFVAGFIGSPQMNFLDVTIVAEDGKLFAILNNDKLEIPAFKHEALTPYIGKTVIMGIRPENFLPFEQRTEFNGLGAKQDFCELLGAETNLYLFVNDQKIIVRIPSTSEVPTHEYIKVPVDLDRTHFFDKETEKAICH